MIVAITGHRPDKLGGWYLPNYVHTAVVEALKQTFAELKPHCVITGMALGVDQWAAEICAANNIPFVAAIPFHGQEGKWPQRSQDRYHSLVQKATATYIITPGEYDPVKMHIRNQWMVDSCDVLVAVWDGSSGGTGACVSYAKKRGRKIHFVKLAPEVWALADKMNHKKQAQLFEDAKSAIPFESDESFGKAVVSPFVSLIKEKAQKKAEELAQEATLYEQAKAKVQELQQQAAKKIAYEKKHKLEYLEYIDKPKEESGKSVIQGFGRILDLDD